MNSNLKPEAEESEEFITMDSLRAGVDETRLNTMTQEVIGAAFAVSNTLGCGFLEKVYENALVIELRSRGLKAQPQHPIPVHYRGELVGDFFGDILVESIVLVELKAVEAFSSILTAQCLNYLRATGLPLCLLMNLGKPKVEIKRLRNFHHSSISDSCSSDFISG